MFRKIASIPIFIASFLFGVAFVFGAFFQNSESFNSSIEYAIDKSRIIQERFHLVSEYLDGYKNENGFLPSQNEYQTWASMQPEMNYHPRDFIRYYTTDFPKESIQKFGKVTDGGYILALWRGEWHEYYHSPTNSSTLVFEATEYKQPLYTTLIQFVISVFLFFIGLLVSSKRLTNASKIAHVVRWTRNKLLAF